VNAAVDITYRTDRPRFEFSVSTPGRGHTGLIRQYVQHRIDTALTAGTTTVYQPATTDPERSTRPDHRDDDSHRM
jgi:hypothetical protein